MSLILWARLTMTWSGVFYAQAGPEIWIEHGLAHRVILAPCVASWDTQDKELAFESSVDASLTKP